MNLLNNLRVAIRSLTSNKLRSGLTMLGIVIGVAAVVALMSVGKGATASITERVESMGSNLITISAQRSFRPGQVGDTSTPLYYSDYEAIVKKVPNIKAAAPVYQSSATIAYQNLTSTFQLYGVTADYFNVYSYTIAEGRAIMKSDNDSLSRVAVIGSEVATELFSGLDPIGREVKISDQTFTVVGVLESKGTSGMSSADNMVLIPLQTGYTHLFGSRALSKGKETLSTIALSATNKDVVDTVISKTEFVLRSQHELGLNDDLGFTVSSQAQALSTLSSVTSTMTTFLGAIAAISLLVGGIGIMNISLVSVSERTREIGLRKAVGAPRRAILVQFLVETMTLALLGGIIGILLGCGIAVIFTAAGLITAKITVDVLLLSFFFAALIGLFFGIYPAYLASKLKPIEALRYE